MCGSIFKVIEVCINILRQIQRKLRLPHEFWTNNIVYMFYLLKNAMIEMMEIGLKCELDLLLQTSFSCMHTMLYVK